MNIKLVFEEAQLLLEVGKHIASISPDLARALSSCYADLAPFMPLDVVTKGAKKLKLLARSRLERESCFGVLSIGTTDSTVLLAALRSHFGTKLLSDMEAALLERFERSLWAMATEQIRGRGRPPRELMESAVPKAPKVTLVATEHTAVIKAPPVWSQLLPPGVDVDWIVSESELQKAYQTLRGVGLQ